MLYKACFKACGWATQRDRRRSLLARLHLFPEDQIPEDLMANVSDHIRQLRPVPRPLHDFSQDDLQRFPKVSDYPEDYVLK